ncbi:thioredoxin F-type, chloroplastic, partial [Tanacetum coccineum]
IQGSKERNSLLFSVYSLLVYLPCLQVPQGDSKYGGSRKEVQGRVAILLHGIVNAVIIFMLCPLLWHGLFSAHRDGNGASFHSHLIISCLSHDCTQGWLFMMHAPVPISSPLTLVCRPVTLPSCFTKQSTDIHQTKSYMMMMVHDKKDGKRKLRSMVKVRSSLEATAGGPTVVVGQVTEVTQDTFWPLVEAAGDKTVVLDMYTQWCGPCKVIAPKFKKLAEEHLDVVFLKLDCNKDNRALAKELGLKVVPTFKILKDNKIVKEVTGAKFDQLVGAIEEAKSS